MRQKGNGGVAAHKSGEGSIGHQGGENLRALVALSMIEQAGPVTIRVLLEQFGNAEAIFEAIRWGEIPQCGIRPQVAEAIAGKITWDAAGREMDAMLQLDIEAISFDSPYYPLLLKQAPDHPVVIYKKGGCLLNAMPTIAIVGTRKPSTMGSEIADEFAQEFARKGFNVVSGLAFGIDASVHSAALEVGGVTTAVMGHGLDIVYPSQHRRLAHLIEAGGGALLSEYVTGTKPDAYNFPARNRIIASMCHATVVVEAQDRGGALITARMAFDQDRFVYAVPGSPRQSTSLGCNKLIRDCVAKLVLSPDEIIEDIRASAQIRISDDSTPKPSGPQKEMNPVESAVAKAKQKGEVCFDDLANRVGMTPQSLASILLDMELNGAGKVA